MTDNTEPESGAFPMYYEGYCSPDSGFNKLAYAAIHLKVPDSGIDWLDKMILEAKRDEMAGRARRVSLQVLPLPVVLMAHMETGQRGRIGRQTPCSPPGQALPQ